MKEFDIYLNKRLTECDIIVYSIPYRDGLTAINRLIMESCVESYTLTKFIAIQTGSELVSHIDEMLKICNERLNNSVDIGVSAQFDIHYSNRPEEIGIVISANSIKLLASSFMEANNALQFAAEPLDARLAKQLGTRYSEITHGIAFSAEAVNGDYATKYLTMQSTVSVLASATESIRQFMHLNESALVLDLEASCILRRYRLLGEMDNNELLSYDDMTLEDVDYVIL